MSKICDDRIFIDLKACPEGCRPALCTALIASKTLARQEKTTAVYFDEKDPVIYIRTHNTDGKKRLLASSRRCPASSKQTAGCPEAGCMEFEIEKGRFF